MRALVVAAACALLLGAAAPDSGASAPASGGSGCELQGSFRIVPSLKTDPHKIHYTITGQANHCTWTDGSTESGTFTARGAGTASCGQGSTAGVAHIAWDDERSSTLVYDTSNFGNLVVLTGRITQGESKGYTAHGVLVFVVDKNEPAGCFTEFGLNRATFYGVCERGESPTDASRHHV